VIDEKLKATESQFEIEEEAKVEEIKGVDSEFSFDKEAMEKLKQQIL